ncbi:MAG: 30S ribosomal protein S16 [Actinomycetota bacterium]
MATRIRLRRLGAKKRPFYRVVVADQRAPRDGRFIENIGKYHPLEDPSLIEIDEERALYWLRVGAQPSSQVRNLMVKTGIWDRFVAERPGAAGLVRARTDKPADAKVSKKAAAKAAAEAEAPPAPIEAPAAPEPVETQATPAPVENSTPAPLEEAVAESVADVPADTEVEDMPVTASQEETPEA